MEEDTGLYDDLFVGASAGQDNYLQDRVQELEEALTQQQQELRALRGALQERDRQFEAVTKERDTLLRNISMLYNTAKAEMARKQGEITNLRAEATRASLVAATAAGAGSLTRRAPTMIMPPLAVAPVVPQPGSLHQQPQQQQPHPQPLLMAAAYTHPSASRRPSPATPHATAASQPGLPPQPPPARPSDLGHASASGVTQPHDPAAGRGASGGHEDPLARKRGRDGHAEEQRERDGREHKRSRDGGGGGSDRHSGGVGYEHRNSSSWQRPGGSDSGAHGGGAVGRSPHGTRGEWGSRDNDDRRRQSDAADGGGREGGGRGEANGRADGRQGPPHHRHGPEERFRPEAPRERRDASSKGGPSHSPGRTHPGGAAGRGEVRQDHARSGRGSAEQH